MATYGDSGSDAALLQDKLRHASTEAWQCSSNCNNASQRPEHNAKNDVTY